MLATVEPLEAKDSDLLRTFLTRDPVQNLRLLGILEEGGVVPKPGMPEFVFWGRFRGRDLVAVLFVDKAKGFGIPGSGDPTEAIALAEPLVGKVTLKACLGETAVVDGILRYFHPGRPKQATSQKLYTVSADDLGPFTNPTLRLAREDDLPALLPLATNALRERGPSELLPADPAQLQAHLLERIRAKRTYVLESAGQIVFKIEVRSRSSHGAELEGLYTVPEERRRGHATLSLGQLSRHLLSSLPRLTLRVDDKDASLAAVARKVGYVSGKAQRWVVV